MDKITILKHDVYAKITYISGVIYGFGPHCR